MSSWGRGLCKGVADEPTGGCERRYSCLHHHPLRRRTEKDSLSSFTRNMASKCPKCDKTVYFGECVSSTRVASFILRASTQRRRYEGDVLTSGDGADGRFLEIYRRHIA